MISVYSKKKYLLYSRIFFCSSVFFSTRPVLFSSNSKEIKEKNKNLFSLSGNQSKPNFNIDNERDDWREPTLADLDRSIPQVDCQFLSNLIRYRTAKLALHRRIQAQVLEKIINHHVNLSSSSTDKNVENNDINTATMLKKIFLPINSKKIKSQKNFFPPNIVSLIESTNEIELINAGVITNEEWDIYCHARPEYDDGFVIIDCRTVNEITSWGIVEGAKVLPAHEMFNAFKLTPEDFKIEFGFDKPHPDQKIIFYCQFGPRSLMAAQILSYFGYPYILHLRDGYHEWAKQYNLLLRRWFEEDERTQNEVNRKALFQAAKELQRDIAKEFNELPIAEAERLLIDESHSPGTIKISEGLRDKCYKQVEELSSKISSSDLKLPPSLNELMTRLRIETDVDYVENVGTYNESSSSKNFIDYMAQYTGIKDEKDSYAHKLSIAAGKEPSLSSVVPVNDFSIEDPLLSKQNIDYNPIGFNPPKKNE